MPAATTPPGWRRRFPRRAVRRLGWYAAAAGAVAAVTWVLFGAEPAELRPGDPNPLTTVPAAVTGLLAAGAAPLLLAVVRRPLVGADHYALRVRPGALRTLLLPWSTVAELALSAGPAGEPVLLVRRRPGRHPGDRPRWYDRAVLRATVGRRAGYHLAVRLDEFAGEPAALLSFLAHRSPRPVTVARADGEAAPPG